MKYLLVTIISIIQLLIIYGCYGGGSEITGKNTIISGRVVTDNATPASNVELTLINDDSIKIDDAQTDKNGRYSFIEHYIPYGKYKIQGSKGSFAFEIDNFNFDEKYVERTDTLKSLGVIVATVDTIFGIVKITLDSINQKAYDYRIAKGSLDIIPRKGNFFDFLPGLIYYDTLFSKSLSDIVSAKNPTYQILASSKNNNIAYWGSICTVFVKQPTTPPQPSPVICTLGSDSMSVVIHADLLQWWWTDSLFIYRSSKQSKMSCIAALKSNNDINLIDTSIQFLKSGDSLIEISYYIRSKSIFDSLSPFSNSSTILMINPYYRYTETDFNTAGTPSGIPDTIDLGGIFNVTVPVVESVVPDDMTEYRLICKTPDNILDTTKWFNIPSIEIPLLYKGMYNIRYQVRSHKLPYLISNTSDSIPIIVNIGHNISKPSTPIGSSYVIHMHPYDYYSVFDSICNYGHNVQIHYVFSYQGENLSDSTTWRSRNTTIVWPKAGTAFLRAQTRCTADTTLYSEWSDALVITVN